MLAVEYQIFNKKTTRKAICLPVNAVQLHINGVTVNSNYFSKLKKSANEGPLMRYIAKKQLWSDTKMESIHWVAFRIARKHHSQYSKQIVKMVNGILPTNKMLYRDKQTLMDKCPFCHMKEETRDHLILCAASEPRKWRTGVLSEVRKVLPRLHIAPALCKVVLHGVHRLFDQPALSRSIDFELYNAQQGLSWMSLFDGIINNKWSEYQENHLWDKKMRTHSSTGDQWTVQIVKFFWEQFFALWKLRNEKVHGTDEKATYKLKAEQYRTTIETMFHL